MEVLAEQKTKTLSDGLVLALAPLPAIPEKKYFTISEAALLCGVKPHVLRYWEQEFSQLKPAKRRNRRYYQYADVLIIRKIRQLLYDDGFTIEGARIQMQERAGEVKLAIKADTQVKKIIAELEAILQSLKVSG